MQAQQSKLLWEEQWPAVRQLIHDVLSNEVPRVTYRQYLLDIVEPWLQQDASDLAIKALPILTCLAVGGAPHCAVPVAAAWQLMRLAAKCLDDVEDGDATEQIATIINAGVGFLCAAQLAIRKLSDLGTISASVQHLETALIDSVMRACAGQHEDLTCQARDSNMDPDTWQEIAAAKSGDLLAWASWAGALAGGANESTLACYRDYGLHLGILLQVADDYAGIWHPGRVSDLATGRITLPISYALLTADAKQSKRLLALLGRATQGDGTAETQTRQILADLGAQAYLLVVAHVQRQYALAAIQEAHGFGPASQELVAVLDRVLPIARLLGA